MKVLVVLVLAVFAAGCNANIVWKGQPKQQVDMVKDAFWEYVATATMTAEDSLKQIRQSGLGKEVNTLISESTDAINKLTDALRTQAAPLTQDLMSKFSQEAEKLKTRLEKDLTDTAPYTESMDTEALKAVLLQKSQELKGQLDKSVSELQAQMVPYTEEIKEKMEQSLEEFQRSMMQGAQSFETQLTQKTQEIQQNLAQRGEELRAKLDMDAQNLKMQLTALWESFTKMTQ
uniref:Apolipoprotein A-IV n=1 Tax=Sander lucioperca TaxID=283035 RepID=A0A8D0CQM4_SANLU